MGPAVLSFTILCLCLCWSLLRHHPCTEDNHVKVQKSHINTFSHTSRKSDCPSLSWGHRGRTPARGSLKNAANSFCYFLKDKRRQVGEWSKGRQPARASGGSRSSPGDRGSVPGVPQLPWRPRRCPWAPELGAPRSGGGFESRSEANPDLATFVPVFPEGNKIHCN